MPHLFNEIKIGAVACADPGRFFAAMLEREEPELRDARRVEMIVDAENAAMVLDVFSAHYFRSMILWIMFSKSLTMSPTVSRIRSPRMSASPPTLQIS